MKITDALRGEHAIFYSLFDLSLGPSAAASGESLGALAKSLYGAILAHATIEDELLFQALDPYLPGAGPLACMRDEHHEIERAFAAAANGGPGAVVSLGRATALAREHFLKEEEVLFPMADEMIEPRRLHAIGAEWAIRRGVRIPRAATTE